ncbi:Hypothetical predicted protein, partial [Mytilus galloprovincialis]
MATSTIVCVPHVSEEEENYLRMHLLVTGISPRAVRILFDKEFHPSQLDASIKNGYGTLSDMKKKRVINTAQWNLLFPRGDKGEGLDPCRSVLLPHKCTEGHINIVQLLLENKADINKCKDDEASPLFIACQQGHKDIVQRLLDHNADINKCNKCEESPLYASCEFNKADIVHLLLNNNADINKCSVDEMSPLFIACQVGHTNIVQLLLDNKSDINKCKADDASPLFIACQEGNTNVVQLLLDNRADINKSLLFNLNPVIFAKVRNIKTKLQIILR